MCRLFIIGNGFDLAHGMPTSFDPDFKKVAESVEQSSNFWDIYQSEESNIWADFEHLLARLEAILSAGMIKKRESDCSDSL